MIHRQNIAAASVLAVILCAVSLADNEDYSGMPPYRRNAADPTTIEKEETIKRHFAAIVDRYADPNSTWDFSSDSDIFALLDARLRYPACYFIDYRLTQFAGRGTPQQRGALLYLATHLRSSICSPGVAEMYIHEKDPRVKGMAIDAIEAVKGRACAELVMNELTSGRLPIQFVLRFARMGIRMGYIDESKSALESNLAKIREPLERMGYLSTLYSIGDESRLEEIQSLLERSRRNPDLFAQMLHIVTSTVFDDKIFEMIKKFASMREKPTATVALLALVERVGLPEDFHLAQPPELSEDSPEPVQLPPLIDPSMPDEMFRERQEMLLAAVSRQKAEEAARPYEE